MTRHELREQIFMLLFRVEFNSIEDMPEQVRYFFENDEMTFTDKQQEYIRTKYDKVMEMLPTLDKMIADNTENWSISRIGKVELALLRLAVYEMLYDEDIPAQVAINEAVELAKRYGQENSGAFVNAVLAKFMKKGDSDS